MAYSSFIYQGAFDFKSTPNVKKICRTRAIGSDADFTGVVERNWGKMLAFCANVVTLVIVLPQLYGTPLYMADAENIADWRSAEEQARQDSYIDKLANAVDEARMQAVLDKANAQLNAQDTTTYYSAGAGQPLLPLIKDKDGKGQPFSLPPLPVKPAAMPEAGAKAGAGQAALTQPLSMESAHMEGVIKNNRAGTFNKNFNKATEDGTDNEDDADDSTASAFDSSPLCGDDQIACPSHAQQI